MEKGEKGNLEPAGVPAELFGSICIPRNEAPLTQSN